MVIDGQEENCRYGNFLAAPPNPDRITNARSPPGVNRGLQVTVGFVIAPRSGPAGLTNLPACARKSGWKLLRTETEKPCRLGQGSI